MLTFLCNFCFFLVHTSGFMTVILQASRGASVEPARFPEDLTLMLATLTLREGPSSKCPRLHVQKLCFALVRHRFNSTLPT